MKPIKLACIIDDDDIFVYAIKRLMQLSRFCENLLVFRNGEDALQYLIPLIESGKQTPEIILLDINMPVMDGWQFLDEFVNIKTKNSITIYMVTSSIDPVDQQRASEYSVVSDFIVKPVTEADLKKMMEQASGKEGN